MRIEEILGIRQIEDKWDEVISPKSPYLIIGDIGEGKTALALWLLERFSQKYELSPAVVNFPIEKRHLLPDWFLIPRLEECFEMKNLILLIDEAGFQFPPEERKANALLTNLLGLCRHRNQIIFLCYHFPRQTFIRHLPYFRAILHKRPNWLALEYGGKRANDVLTQMLKEAEEHFSQITDTYKFTYIHSIKLRWKGLLENPLPSFWSQELSEAFSGVKVEIPHKDESIYSFWNYELLATDGKTPITPEMRARRILVEEMKFTRQTFRIYMDPITGLQWVEVSW